MLEYMSARVHVGWAVCMESTDSLTWVRERVLLRALDDIGLVVGRGGERCRQGNKEGDEQCFGLHVGVAYGALLLED